jgi:hypothetical protein
LKNEGSSDLGLHLRIYGGKPCSHLAAKDISMAQMRISNLGGFEMGQLYIKDEAVYDLAWRL